MADVNLLAVLVAAIAATGVGMFWYSPAGFGKAWMRLSGLSQEKMNQMKNKGMGKTYTINFIATLVMAYVLANFVGVWGAVGVAGAFSIAFWVWLGFIATVMLGSVLWEGKPTKLYVINISFYLVSLFLMALILVYWV